MSDSNEKDEAGKRVHLLGLGLDGQRDEVRITKGPNFHVLGGSEPTHERMQEVCIQFNEELKSRGRSADKIDTREAREIVRDIVDRMG